MHCCCMIVHTIIVCVCWMNPAFLHCGYRFGTDLEKFCMLSRVHILVWQKGHTRMGKGHTHMEGHSQGHMRLLRALSRGLSFSLVIAYVMHMRGREIRVGLGCTCVGLTRWSSLEYLPNGTRTWRWVCVMYAYGGWHTCMGRGWFHPYYASDTCVVAEEQSHTRMRLCHTQMGSSGRFCCVLVRFIPFGQLFGLLMILMNSNEGVCFSVLYMSVFWGLF